MPSPRNKIIGIARFDDARGNVREIEVTKMPPEVFLDDTWWERWTLLGADDTPDGKQFALYRPRVPA